MFQRWLEKIQGAHPSASASHGGEKFPRHSGGWAWLRSRLQSESGLRLIDNGATSPFNINFLTALGHSVFLADLVQEACSGEWDKGVDEAGNPIWDCEGYLDKAMHFGGRTFDVVLLWTALDYLPEPLVQPVVTRLHESMNEGGRVLAFFHTRMQGEETAYCRFHLTQGDEVEMQFAEDYPIRRAFTNRSIEKLFHGWSDHKQFLAKDSLSEVIITR